MQTVRSGNQGRIASHKARSPSIRQTIGLFRSLSRRSTSTPSWENNRQKMHYDQYLAAGYPIGSGVIEGACRHVVKDRMEQSGMRWTLDGAQSMLHLRSIYLNGDWQAFDEHRIQTEQATLYGQAA